LITEAMVIGYERYVDRLWDAAESAGTDPTQRLLAWVDRQIDWTVENAGLGAALNFPHVASGMPLEVSESAVARLAAAGSRNFENLQSLVRHATAHVRGLSGVEAADPLETSLDAAAIGWITLGLSVWSAGRHSPTQQLNTEASYRLGREHVRKQVLEIISR
jgi:hypothetical protein